MITSLKSIPILALNDQGVASSLFSAALAAHFQAVAIPDDMEVLKEVLPVTALVRMQCYGPTCLLRDDATRTRPEIVQLFRVTGDACCVLVIVVSSMEAFERLIDHLAEHGRPSSTMVLSTPIPWRGVDPA